MLVSESVKGGEVLKLKKSGKAEEKRRKHTINSISQGPGTVCRDSGLID